MKTRIPISGCLLKSLMLCSVISLNSFSQCQSTTSVSKANSQLSQRPYSFGIESKLTNDNNDTDIKSNNYAPSPSAPDDGFSTNLESVSTVKITVNTFQLWPSHSKIHHLSRLNEKTLYSNVPRFHKFDLIPSEMDLGSNKRDLDPFDLTYPVFRHRVHFSNYARSFYPPYFLKNYNLGRIDRHLTNKNHIADKFNFDNQVYYPDKIFSFANSDDTFPPPYFIQKSRSDASVKPFSLIGGSREIVRPFFHDNLEEKSNSKIKNFEKVPLEDENTFDYSEKEITDDLPTESVTKSDILSNNLNIRNTFAFPKAYTQKIAEINAILTPERKPSTDIGKKASENSSSVRKKEKRFDHTFIPDNSSSSNLNLLASNRVYFERMPSNVNNSWFVYVNCSRDKCQLTNGTDETELMNEGWILHNCTHYGCSEMYPRTESVQKFIGLMLLVFSLCLLKIVAFLLVFYYCRRIKLTKDDAEGKGESKLDKDMPDILYEKGKSSAKDILSETASKQRLKSTDADAIYQSLSKGATGENASEKTKEIDMTSFPNEVEKFRLKVWTPPVQRVSPCLLASLLGEKKNIVIPQKCLEKKTPAVRYVTEKFSKPTKKGCSNIPRLEKALKGGSRNEIKQDYRISGNENMKTTKLIGETQNNEELLLMNWDEEISTDCTYPTGEIEKAPNWKTFMENECKSFISLDLNE